MTEAEQRAVCPTCSAALDEKQYDGIEIDECSACGDLWFDRYELADYLAFRKAGSTGVDWAGRLTDVADPSTALGCPRCDGSRLSPHKWGSFRFNRCKQCFGAHVAHEDLERFIDEVGEAEGIRGGEAIVAAIGSIAGIFVRLFESTEGRS